MNYKFSIFLASFVAMLTICGSIKAQEVKPKTSKTSKMVRSGKDWIAIKTNFEYHEEYTELQKFISNKLFKEENTSVSKAFENYLKTFDEVKNPDGTDKTKGQIESFMIECTGGSKGKYFNYAAGYSKKKLGAGGNNMITKNMVLNFIFDVKHNKILKLDDIFAPDVLKELKAVMGNASPQMNMDKESIVVAYEKDGNQKTLNAQYKNEALFSEEFKEFIKEFQKEKIIDELHSANDVIRDRVIAFSKLTNDLLFEKEKVFDIVERMPQFKGGNAALMEYLNRNIKYPKEAEDNGIQGRVVCTFIIEPDGSITDVMVTKSIDPYLDKEAVRVIKSMPKWNPGMQFGDPVRVKYTLPVTFRLQ